MKHRIRKEEMALLRYP